MTQKQQDIVADLIIDNGLIWNEVQSEYDLSDALKFSERINSIVRYCHTLFMETVYNKEIDDVDYVQMRIANLLATIAKYRDDYDSESIEYTIMNSFFDKTLEAFNDFNDVIYG